MISRPQFVSYLSFIIFVGPSFTKHAVSFHSFQISSVRAFVLLLEIINVSEIKAL